MDFRLVKTIIGTRPYTRRRPGQRAIASKVQGLSSYNLDQDKKLRAEAKFHAISLGQACKQYPSIPYRYSGEPLVLNKDEQYPVVDNVRPTDEEVKIASRINWYESDTASPLKMHNPVLFDKVKTLAVNTLKERLAREARARHVPPTISYVEYLSTLARYKPLELLDSQLEIPY